MKTTKKILVIAEDLIEYQNILSDIGKEHKLQFEATKIKVSVNRKVNTKYINRIRKPALICENKSSEVITRQMTPEERKQYCTKSNKPL